MKILIIGSNGFIGKHCVDYFSKHHQITAQGVTQDFESLFKIQKYDVCINASGSANVGVSFENPAIDFELNVLNVNKLLVAIRQHNPTCKFINFSSAAVYGNPMKLPITENAPTKPLSPYGFHKLQSEYLLTEYHKFFGLHTCSLRIFSAYGQGLKKQLFWDLYQKYLQNQEEIAIFGTGEESRDFIFIDDLINAVEIILEKNNFEGQAINVASGNETTIKEVVNTFFGILDNKTKIIFSGKVKIGDPNNWCADIKKLKQLGFEPQFDLKTGLEKHIQWLKEKISIE